MTEREIVYFNGDGTVATVAVVGTDDPNILMSAYGYAEWVDRSDTPGASMGWTRVQGEWRYPQPYPSWIWAGTDWVAPTPMPAEGGPYRWDEATLSWVELT